MEQQSLHLSDAQIEQYGNTSSATGAEAGQQIETHLADCPACCHRLLVSQRVRFALMGDSPVNTASFPDRRGPHCPSEDDLRNLAAGLYPPDQATKLTEHAAQCDHCGALLRMYSEDFSEELGKEDEAVLGELKSSSAGWQKKLVSQIFTSSGTAPEKSAKRSSFWRWVLVPTAATVCAAVAFAVWYSQRETPEKVEKLLAQAYTEQRTIEMRFPGAAWAPVRVIRGEEDSRFSKPAPLLDAEGIIRHKQAADPNDAEWLRAKAEADILDRNPEPAIAGLNQALASRPASVPLMLDLSIAYVQQAQSSHDRQNYAKAIELLTKITRNDPGNREAIFNLALTYTRSEMWDQAAATWEAYLRLDPEGPWAQEAKQNLDLAKSKLKASLQGPPEASMDAGTFLRLSDAEVNFNSERYQDMALLHWLAPAMADPHNEEHRAISRLAGVMSHNHSDLWLQDFLGSPTTRDSSGARALSAAFTANTKGHYAEAIKQSHLAEELFHSQHDFPGELRARYESVYASQRFLHGKECLVRADPLETAVAATTYHWLQSQVALERAICLNFTSNLSAVSSELSSSLNTAKRFHFPILALRNIGISQGLEIQQGKYDAAWEAGLQGLGDYWTGPPSGQRVYQFYVGLALSAEHRELWSAAEVLLRHAINILTEEDSIQRGAALLELAKILIAEKQDSTAEDELIEANRLFDREPGEPTARSYLLAGKIGLAELQFKRGRPAEALSTLEPVQELLSETDGYFVSLRYYQLFGNISLQLKQLDRASEAYKSAVVIVEKSLGGIKNDSDRLQWMQAADDAYRGLVRVLIEERNQADSLRLWEWQESRPSQESTVSATHLVKDGRISWPRIWASAAGVSWHEGNAVRIIYAVFNDGIQIWTISSDKLTTAWVPTTRVQLEKMIQQFSQGCARPDSPLAEVQQQGQDLFSLLLQPVIDELPAGSVVAVELDRSLAGLPVEALRSPAGWYFAERYPVIYSPGVVREKHLRNPEPVNASRSFLLADASEGSGGSYLPGSELERETISRLFPRKKIIGSEAGLAETQTLLAKSDIFGFIGHGERNGTGTALRVNPGLLLRTEDFSPLILQRLQMAVLAACATGLGGENGLLDNRNLVHAFLAGDVPSVIASNWNVDSVATAKLMKAFYLHFARGESAAMALFAARTEILKVRTHPYFWAAFNLIGKTS